MTWASSGFSVVFSCFNFSLEEVEPEPKENDEIVGWHHQLNGLEFEQTPGDGEVQGSLTCCSPWDHKESDKNFD